MLFVLFVGMPSFFVLCIALVYGELLPGSQICVQVILPPLAITIVVAGTVLSSLLLYLFVAALKSQLVGTGKSQVHLQDALRRNLVGCLVALSSSALLFIFLSLINYLELDSLRPYEMIFGPWDVVVNAWAVCYTSKGHQEHDAGAQSEGGGSIDHRHDSYNPRIQMSPRGSARNYNASSPTSLAANNPANSTEINSATSTPVTNVHGLFPNVESTDEKQEVVYLPSGSPPGLNSPPGLDSPNHDLPDPDSPSQDSIVQDSPSEFRVSPHESPPLLATEEPRISSGGGGGSEGGGEDGNRDVEESRPDQVEPLRFSADPGMDASHSELGDQPKEEPTVSIPFNLPEKQPKENPE